MVGEPVQWKRDSQAVEVGPLVGAPEEWRSEARHQRVHWEWAHWELYWVVLEGWLRIEGQKRW